MRSDEQALNSCFSMPAPQIIADTSAHPSPRSVRISITKGLALPFLWRSSSPRCQQVNEYQAKIKDTTRKMMAIVSELSMNQATAMKLQQEVKGREQELEQAYVRMERGEAPNDDAEREWNRMVRDELRRAQDVHETKEVRGTEAEGGGGRRKEGR